MYHPLRHLLVPVTGLEPVRFLRRGILSPLCLPIPPHRQVCYFILLGSVGKSLVSTYSSVCGARPSPCPEGLRRWSTAAHAYALLYLPLAAQSNAAVCGARRSPRHECLRCSSTAAHAAPSLYLPPAALGLAATPAGGTHSIIFLGFRQGAFVGLFVIYAVKKAITS